MTFGELFRLILPVFALIAVGVALRRFHWVEGQAETSLLRLVVYVCMPCLVFDTVIGNTSLRNPSNILLPPMAGFGLTVTGLAAAYAVGKMAGLAKGTGLRTFALSAGIPNYSYLPFPIIGGLWGERTQGVLLVHNMGVDLAIWSVGIVLLTGGSVGDNWRRIVSPMLVTLIASVAINVGGLSADVPGFLRSMSHSLGICAVPMGLVLTGVSLADYLDEPSTLLHRNVAVGAIAVRILIVPAVILCAAHWIPLPEELRRVLVVQAAMPAAVIPIILSRHYGGQPLTAVQVVLSTTAVGLVTCPLWIRAGLSWLGLS